MRKVRSTSSSQQSYHTRSVTRKARYVTSLFRVVCLIRVIHVGFSTSNWRSLHPQLRS